MIRRETSSSSGRRFQMMVEALASTIQVAEEAFSCLIMEMMDKRPEYGGCPRGGHQTTVVTSYDREVEEILSDRLRSKTSLRTSQEISRGRWDGTTRTSRWEKVLEALGSPWKLMEDLEDSCRRL
ncbi:hypothetical protein Tco_0477826 [Tanacetum coccineum]